MAGSSSQKLDKKRSVRTPALDRQTLLTGSLFVLAAVIGVVALSYPFFLPAVARSGDALEPVLRTNETPFLAALLISLCLSVLLVELQGTSAGIKTVATLGILVAATSTLRFIEVAIPGPGGFSPVFVPIILAGYVFGPRFGFMMGAMTLLVSAIITAGVGPWLPYQMFSAGWIGLTAGWLPHPRAERVELAMLAIFGFLWGFVYGAIMNLYTWPFLMGDPTMTWNPGAGLVEGVKRYAVFYLATSLVWDLAAAVGNVILVVVLGLPAVRALARFRERLHFRVTMP